MKSESSLTTSSIHSDLNVVKEIVYDKCGFNLTNLKQSDESIEYGACTFDLNHLKIQYRISKITPTKTGQFVTIWKRDKEGVTEPFNVSDDFDFIIISSRSGNNFGQFVFPKYVLAHKGVITQNGKAGKRGIRVYPPWDFATSKQAENTQRWQTKYFLTIKDDCSTDLELAKRLFAKTNEIE